MWPSLSRLKPVKSFLQRIRSESGRAPDGEREERAKQKSPGKETACSRPAEQ